MYLMHVIFLCKTSLVWTSKSPEITVGYDHLECDVSILIDVTQVILCSITLPRLLHKRLHRKVTGSAEELGQQTHLIRHSQKKKDL